MIPGRNRQFQRGRAPGSSLRQTARGGLRILDRREGCRLFFGKFFDPRYDILPDG